MVYDYAKRPPPPRRKKRTALTVLLIAAAMILPATLYYFKFKKAIAEPNKTSQPTPIKPIKITKVTKPTKPSFDFYTLLPKMAVPVPQATLRTNNLPQTKNHYLLQIAALKNPNDAERLKSRLLTLGFTASVQSYQNSHGTRWNRVLVGPFDSTANAQKAQDALDQQRIDSMILTVKKI